MTNPLWVLAGLLIASAYPIGSEPLRFAREPALSWALPAVFLGYALLCSAVLRRPRAEAGQGRRSLRLAALGLYAVLIFVFHLPLGVWTLGLEDDPLLSSLLILAPLLGLFGILAVLDARYGRYRGGLAFAFRGFLGLSLLPLFVMLSLAEVFERIPPLRRAAFLYPSLGWLVAFTILPLSMLLLPPLLRLLLGARPLEAGPLRERLERLCASANFRAAELLVVPTGRSRLSNAFVVGLASRWRYVFFTDGILEGMSAADLECVLAHELTHSQKRHIPCYLVAAISFALLSGFLHEALENAGVPPDMVTLSGAGFAGLFWLGGFGYVSRRFETEADLVAARLAPAAEGGLAPYAAARNMAVALDRVAVLNGVPPTAPSWRHFTIQHRIDILLRAEREPAYGLAFERLSRRLRQGAVVLLVAALAAGAALVEVQLERVEQSARLLAAHESVQRGQEALEAGKFREAKEFLQAGIEGGSSGAAAWIWLADAQRALGLEQDARESEAKARTRDVSDPRLRLRLAR